MNDDPYTTPDAVGSGSEAPSKTPTVLAIIGLVTWLIPLIGLPVSGIGLYKAIQLRSKFPQKYGISIVLLVIGLFAGVVNAGIGAYMGATGQHQLVNQLQGK